MKMKQFGFWVLALALAVLPALAQKQETFKPPQKRVVTSSEMGRYMKSIEKMIAIGETAQLDAKPDQQMAPKYNSQMMQVVRANGFDETSFTQVHWNVTMGYMAAELEARQVDFDAARKKQEAEMAKMKEHMSPAQYEQMMKGMSGMFAMTEIYKDIPPENIALVKKNKAKLDKIFDNEQRR